MELKVENRVEIVKVENIPVNINIDIDDLILYCNKGEPEDRYDLEDMVCEYIDDRGYIYDTINSKLLDDSIVYLEIRESYFNHEELINLIEPKIIYVNNE